MEAETKPQRRVVKPRFSALPFSSFLKLVKTRGKLINLVSMKNPARFGFAIVLLLCSSALRSSATPIDFGEVSLLVRAHETELSIIQDVAQRKLLHKLTPDQERTLKAQGASDSLVQNLRSTNFVLSTADAAAFEADRAQARKGREANVAQQDREGTRAPTENVHIFNAAFGRPVNLSRWGGSDYEIVFNSYRYAGEDYVEPVIVDNVRTGTEVIRIINPMQSEDEAFTRDWHPKNEVRNWRYTPYDARGDLKDNRFNFSDSVVGTSYSVTRPIQIDWDSPVYFDGQPYTFYPVYGTGSVSLYYIGKASDTSARLAVVTPNR
jgi:Skp family chaperone for outer membrane proteins